MLREAEYRSTALFPYWNVPLLRWLVPRQRRCLVALQVVNQTLNTLISKCKRLVRAPTRAPDVLHSVRPGPSSTGQRPAQQLGEADWGGGGGRRWTRRTRSLWRSS